VRDTNNEREKKMILNISKAKLSKNVEMLAVPNGGVAVLDTDGRMVAYNKVGEPDGNNWDWVRKDCQK
jgi:hypothetical protein